jgi:hypothetical protein
MRCPWDDLKEGRYHKGLGRVRPNKVGTCPDGLSDTNGERAGVVVASRKTSTYQLLGPLNGNYVIGGRLREATTTSKA